MAPDHPSPNVTRTAWRRTVSVAVAAAMALAAPASTFAPARAQEDAGDKGGLPIVRDAEIEQLLRDYTQPILRAAGLEKQNVRVVIINDPQFNAFVMDGRHIFINTGALLQAETPNEVIGVLAHETGQHLGGAPFHPFYKWLSSEERATEWAMTVGLVAVFSAQGREIGDRGSRELRSIGIG